MRLAEEHEQVIRAQHVDADAAPNEDELEEREFQKLYEDPFKAYEDLLELGDGSNPVSRPTPATFVVAANQKRLEKELAKLDSASQKL